MSARFLVLGAVALATGCTHTHLRHSVVRQTRTLNDVYYEQVLDNLAMYTVAPAAMPHFAVAGAGLTQVDSSGQSNVGLEWDPTGLSRTVFGVNGQRRVAESWNLLPVSDPDRLRRMRCAFQIAVGMHNPQAGSPCPECVDCCQLLGEFYGDEHPCCVDPCRIPGPGWYCVGQKCDVPDGALFVGEHEGRYVWVTRGGLDELTRFTFAVLDLATKDPPAPARYEVETTYRANVQDGVFQGYKPYEVRVKTATTKKPEIEGVGTTARGGAVPDAAPGEARRSVPFIFQPFAIPLD